MAMKYMDKKSVWKTNYFVNIACACLLKIYELRRRELNVKTISKDC